MDISTLHDRAAAARAELARITAEHAALPAEPYGADHARLAAALAGARREVSRLDAAVARATTD